ncbi:MAG: XRE family transcriptional regulator [Desulfatiglans sp.]|jgi:transcriptional regulator with XRE-family HTH domain|nr:XRE family transcriptional regulator [Thermodesulfobacteriota bacterium]MEE4354288.1 XRE family transcriptional regulator [Desulfatiglans sp.]
MIARKKVPSIGKRLMKLRKEKGLTLKNLANETGLAQKYISSVEKGESTPPVSVLLQLSRALEVDSSILLRDGQESTDEAYQKRTEAYTYETLTPEARHKHLKAFKVFIDPGTVHEGVSYQHLGEEFHYMIRGKIEVMVGENKNVLSPGQCLHFNSSIVHKLRNIGKEKAEILVVLYTP